MTLTREEILAMKPGEELDKLIDGIIFQRTFTEFPMGWCYHNGRGWVHASPYSFDISAAWEVVKEINKKGFYFDLDQDHDYEFAAYFRDGYYQESITTSVMHTANTAPEVICKAAILAVLNL